MADQIPADVVMIPGWASRIVDKYTEEVDHGGPVDLAIARAISEALTATRAGAIDFEIGYLRDDVPVEKAGWWAAARYKGARIVTDEHRSPTTAAIALAERILADATCRCTKRVTLSDAVPGCRWRLVGRKWEPGCDEPPLRITGLRGDHAAMQRALGNRAERRAAQRKRGSQ